jgi:ATP-dependent exoDNAse (exonuclease V) beta subunit
MLKAYINYPNPHVTAHYDPNCANVQAQRKTNQRYCRINPATITTELANFRTQKYTFASYAEKNDMWLEINFQDQDFELAVLEHVCRMLGRHYRPLAGLKPSRHCLDP